MTWEHFEIKNEGKCKIAAVNSTNSFNCKYELGIITTGKSREFWGYQIILNIDSEEFIGRDHSSGDSYTRALDDLNRKLEGKGFTLLVSGNDKNYSESGLSAGTGYGYVNGRSGAVDIMESFNEPIEKHALIYLHGFNSASEDEQGNILLSKRKLRVLADFCKENDYRFLAPNLNYQNIGKVVEQLRNIRNELNVDGYNVNYIGTSLGGFLAEYMAMITVESAIMINPTTKPTSTLSRYIGKCKNYVTNDEYTWSQANCDAFRIYEEDLLHFPDGEVGRTVILDMGDELLNSSDTIKKYKGKVSLHTFEGGSHRFDHMAEALPTIKDSIENIFLPLVD